MILFLLTNWRWLIPSAAAVILGVALGWSRMELTSLHAKIDKQNLESTELLVELTATAAAKDSAASDFARNLDQEHNNAVEAITAAGADAERRYTNILRRIASSRPSCAGAVATEAVNSEYAANAAARGRDRLFEEIGNELRETGEGANRLAATVRTCVTWAHEVGR